MQQSALKEADQINLVCGRKAAGCCVEGSTTLEILLHVLAAGNSLIMVLESAAYLRFNLSSSQGHLLILGPIKSRLKWE